jgi:hypothetical protein
MHLSSPARLLHRAMFEWGDSLALFNLAGRSFGIGIRICAACCQNGSDALIAAMQFCSTATEKNSLCVFHR